MAYTIGRCINDLYCVAASGKQTFRIPLASPFVCPQCGKPLAEPVIEQNGMRSPAVMACCGLVAAGGALFALGAMMSDRPAVTPAPAHQVEIVLAPPGPQAEAAPGAAVQPSTSANPAQALSSQGSAATDVSPPAEDVAQSAPGPTLLPDPTPAMRLAMVGTGAKDNTPPPAVTRSTRAPSQPEARAQVQTARPARAAELARRNEQQKAMGQQHAEEKRRRAELLQREAIADQTARQQAAGIRAAQVAAETKRRLLAEAKSAAAAVPTGMTRGFSPRVVAGGAPVFPAAYENDGRSGRVTVSCEIMQTGAPRGCHVLTSEGGAGFDNAVLSWLGSGQVRFVPILRDGVARVEEHSWSLNFQP